MDIPSYIKAHELTQTQFGELVGVSQGMVWQWINGKRPVSPLKAREIETATNGAISAASFHPKLFGTQPTEAA